MTIPCRYTLLPDSTTCNAVFVSHHVVMWRLQRLFLRDAPGYLHKGAETGDGAAYDEGVHFTGAFVGVNGLGRYGRL